MRWICFIQIKNNNSKSVSPEKLVELILSFADVKKEAKTKNICLNNFGNNGFGTDFFKHNILKFECDSLVYEKICNWFENDNKFKKFSYEYIDYEVLGLLWHDSYSSNPDFQM